MAHSFSRRTRVLLRPYWEVLDSGIVSSASCCWLWNVLRFLQHGTYHVVVRGGSHFCQSPKGGGVRSVFIKTQGRANTFLGKKSQNSPALPPPRKNVPSLTLKCYIHQIHYSVDITLIKSVHARNLCAVEIYILTGNVKQRSRDDSAKTENNFI